MKIFALKCKVTKSFGVPFPCSDEGAAKQIVLNTLMQGEEQLAITLSEQYSLFCLGDFDSNQGIVKARPKLVSDLVDIPGFVEACKLGIQRLATLKEDGDKHD